MKLSDFFRNAVSLAEKLTDEAGADPKSNQIRNILNLIILIQHPDLGLGSVALVERQIMLRFGLIWH